jgi:hypothetical protein
LVANAKVERGFEGERNCDRFGRQDRDKHNFGTRASKLTAPKNWSIQPDFVTSARGVYLFE